MKKTVKSTIILVLLLVLSSTVWGQIDIPPVDIKAEIINGTQSSYLLRVEYVFPEGYHQTLQEDMFKMEIVSDSDISLGSIIYPETVTGNYYGRTILEAEVINFNPDKGDNPTVKAYWQLCNEEGMCLFPQSAEITVEPSYTVAGAKPKVSPGFSADILFFLVLSFLGGLLLNVMPCVLPVLSIKALSFVNQGGDDKKKILHSSLLYTAGVIISLLILAIIIIIIKASGEQVGWGFQFQNRGFVLVLLSVIFVFALSLFDVFTISAPVIRAGAPMKKKNNAGAHFFSGVIAVLLATPCTAPFLGAAAGFAFSQTAPVILAVFFMVGLGLSFPFILIGFIPKLVSKLPKPGPWMNTFREIMGFLLIGTSVWLIDVLAYQSGSVFLIRVLVYLTAVTVAVWLYGKISGPGASRIKRLTGLAVAVIIISASAVTLLGTDNTVDDTDFVAEDSHYSGWLEFSPETVYENIGGDRPVFLAFGAKWCMTCRTNETTVLFTDETSDFFEDNNVILIHGDYTNKNHEITEWLSKFDRVGVPFYSWYPAGSTEAVLLPEIINRRMIMNLVNLSANN